jgi:hypothetical protein
MYWQPPVGPRGPVTRARAWWSVPTFTSKAVDEFPQAANTAIADREIRAELVARVRQEIAEGRYETAEKWDEALDRLLARLA